VRTQIAIRVYSLDVGAPAQAKSAPAPAPEKSAHAVRSLVIARKKLVGQRVTLENQIRGLALQPPEPRQRPGDGSLIEFRSGVDAVRRIEFRVGIHLGDA
jgi:hypothetical protein